MEEIVLTGIRRVDRPPQRSGMSEEARSSVGEHYPDTVGVGGSIPPVPMVHPSKLVEDITAI